MANIREIIIHGLKNLEWRCFSSHGYSESVWFEKPDGTNTSFEHANELYAAMRELREQEVLVSKPVDETRFRSATATPGFPSVYGRNFLEWVLKEQVKPSPQGAPEA
jgi:hypothetical protein